MHRDLLAPNLHRRSRRHLVPVSEREVLDGATIVEASSRFVAHGGLWQPSASLEQRILQAALGELKCARLRHQAEARRIADTDATVAALAEKL